MRRFKSLAAVTAAIAVAASTSVGWASRPFCHRPGPARFGQSRHRGGIAR